MARQPHRYLLLLLLCFRPDPATAQTANPRVDAIFAEWSVPTSPGCALGVYRDDRIVYARGYGMADLERRVPIAAHSVFDIGSTSKQITAASVLLLAQQGKLSLDDDIRRHVPEVPAYSKVITIRQLLHHTSGIRDYIGLLQMAGHDVDDVTTVDDALSMIARQKELNFEPGERHLYSNAGYFLLSLVVERASGMTLPVFARMQIFEPLGMTRTHYMGSYDDVVPDRALAYSRRDDGTMRLDVSRWLQLGDGAVFTTVEDMQRWDANFYDPRVGGEALVRELLAPGRLNDGSEIEYARGLMHGSYRGLKTVSHGGSWGGYNAELVRFPDQHFSVALFCNLGSIDPVTLALRVADEYLGDVMAPAAAAATPPVLATPAFVMPPARQQMLTGLWTSGAAGLSVEIVADTSGLRMVAGDRHYPLRPRSDTVLDVMDGPAGAYMQIEPGPAGQPLRMQLVGGGQVDTLLHRGQPTLTDADLATYAGSYRSDELQVTYDLEIEGAQLRMHQPGRESVPLRAVARDEFTDGHMTIRFRHSAAGLVTGYVLDTPRARNLWFALLQKD